MHETWPTAVGYFRFHIYLFLVTMSNCPSFIHLCQTGEIKKFKKEKHSAHTYTQIYY